MLQFGSLKRRPFAFYPPILNVEHNEWRARNSSGPEILVSNLSTGLEVWIPKRWIGQISGGEAPLLSVSLLRELEYKAGGLEPYERRVVEMPGVADSGSLRTPAWKPRRSRGRWLVIALLAAFVVCLLAVALLWFTSLLR